MEEFNKDNKNQNENSDTVPDQKFSFKSVLIFAVQIILAGGIIYWLIKNNSNQIIKAFEHFNFLWLIPAALLYASHILVGAWRWRMLLKVQKINITFWDSLSLTMQGFFFSLVLPGGALGGDVIKAAFLIKKTPKGNKLIGSFTILVDRIIGMSSLFSLAAIFAILSLDVLNKLSGTSVLLIYLLIAGCCGGLGAVIVLFFHDKFLKIPGFKKIIAIINKFSHNAANRLFSAIDSFRNAWKSLLLAFIISIFFVHGMISAVVFCIAGGLGSLSAKHSIYILATSIANAAACIPATQSGLGIRDFFLQAILRTGGIIKADAITIALIYTAIILSFNLIGGLFFAFSKNISTALAENKENR